MKHIAYLQSEIIEPIEYDISNDRGLVEVSVICFTVFGSLFGLLYTSYLIGLFVGFFIGGLVGVIIAIPLIIISYILSNICNLLNKLHINHLIYIRSNVINFDYQIVRYNLSLNQINCADLYLNNQPYHPKSNCDVYIFEPK